MMATAKEFIWDENFPLLTLLGEGSKSFLQGQTTVDCYKVDIANPFKACLLSTVGNLKALLEIKITNLGADLIVLEGDFQYVKKYFQTIIFPADQVEIISNREIRRIQVISDQESWKSSTVQWNYSHDHSNVDCQGSLVRSSHDLAIWKMYQGFPSFPSEINDKNNPFELGLGDLLDFTKGCFLGQEAISRIRNKASLRKQLRTFNTDSRIEKGDKLFQNISQINNQAPSGIVSSVHELKKGDLIGLAIIKSSSLSDKKLYTENSKEVKIKVPIGFNDI